MSFVIKYEWAHGNKESICNLFVLSNREAEVAHGDVTVVSILQEVICKNQAKYVYNSALSDTFMDERKRQNGKLITEGFYCSKKCSNHIFFNLKFSPVNMET